jgi:hypothetical protein
LDYFGYIPQDKGRSVLFSPSFKGFQYLISPPAIPVPTWQCHRNEWAHWPAGKARLTEEMDFNAGAGKHLHYFYDGWQSLYLFRPEGNTR